MLQNIVYKIKNYYINANTILVISVIICHKTWYFVVTLINLRWLVKKYRVTL